MANAISKSFDVEFNDSVLDLAGWKNPRTEGSKLTGRFVNYYNDGDKTYGKNPVIENKIAALYLGNTIIGGMMKTHLEYQYQDIVMFLLIEC